MKRHLIERYEDLTVTHSFADESGQIFDCIPVRQQPSLKGTDITVAEAPDLPSPQTRGDAAAAQPPLRPDRADMHGNAMWCPPGTIPVRRITIEEMTRFESLDDFFLKSPLDAVHKYAHAAQTVDNLGGRSSINLWDPAVGSEIFSLSQQWYAAGSPVQTVEAGWQVYPGKYGTTQPVLFIFWTPDGYKRGGPGSYNLDKPGFVQTGNNWPLGGILSPISIAGGAQYEITICYYLSQGNWWLYVGGDAVGYYPATLFGNGPMASNAANIDFGGETVDKTAWPPMGSGAFARTGYQQAAYHRAIEYFPITGGSQSAQLVIDQPSPNCYTINLQSGQAPWSEYFYFGGPGGANC
ncbi:MAG: neprosin family prolyl endopeptidase [Deltaproteobacteria bacterium]|nr:neprosin family prolyl endopeptidase [Deltaproteobacteria bacterium]